MIFSFLAVAQSEAVKSFKASIEGTFDILEFETLEEIEDASAIDYLVVDYDSDPQITKTLKKIKKLFPELFLILLSNKLSSKELIKHQKGKLAADVYLRTPVSLESLLKVLDLELEEQEASEKENSSVKNSSIKLNDAQKEIILAHMPGHEVSYEAKVLSDEIQELFDEVYTPKNFLTQDASSTLKNPVSLEDNTEDEGEDFLELVEDEEEALPDLPPDIQDESNQIEEPIMAQNQKKDDLDLEEMSLDLGSEESTEDISLSDDEDALSLDNADEAEDLLSLSEETQGGLDLEEGLDLSLGADDDLDLSGGGDDLDLSGGDDDLDLSSGDDDLDLSGGDDDLDLSSGDDDLDLSGGGDDLDLSGGNDDLDLSGGGDDLDLSSGGDDLDLSGGGDDLDLSSGADDLDLSGGNDDLDLSGGDDLDLSISDDEIEEDDLNFGAMDDLNQEESASDLSLSEESTPSENDEMDDLNLFGELPSSPEIDALNLDDEGEKNGAQEELSAEALEKLKEIDDLMSEDEEAAENDEVQEEQIESYAFANDQPETSLKEEHSEVMQHHHQELDRLGVTLSEMRKDRNLLLEELDKIKNQMEEQKREMLSIRSELDEKKIENSVIRKRYEKQVEDLKFQLDLSNEKKSLLEIKNREFEKEYQKLNQKVRIDIKKIQTREKELESQIELLKADSEIQIKNRDQKILELKRKIDSLEFDLESVQVNERRSVTSKHDLEDKMERVIKTLRLAIGELEDSENSVRTLEKIKKSLDV